MANWRYFPAAVTAPKWHVTPLKLRFLGRSARPDSPEKRCRAAVIERNSSGTGPRKPQEAPGRTKKCNFKRSTHRKLADGEPDFCAAADIAAVQDGLMNQGANLMLTHSVQYGVRVHAERHWPTAGDVSRETRPCKGPFLSLGMSMWW